LSISIPRSSSPYPCDSQGLTKRVSHHTAARPQAHVRWNGLISKKTRARLKEISQNGIKRARF
jgi:hypothetical protein